MNYIAINFEEIQGYKKLSETAKELLENTYQQHNAGQGLEYKNDWVPVRVTEHKTHLKVYFKNGDWLHYYANGSWG